MVTQLAVQFDENGNPVVDNTGLYRPRDVAAPAPKTPAPQAVSSTGDTYDTSSLYKPRYVEENPNNFGSQLAAATRPGSVLNIIGTMTGGGQSAAAHKYNAAERMKFEDSVAAARLELENRRLQNEMTRASHRDTSWQDDVWAAYRSGDITYEQLQETLHGRPSPPAQPRPAPAPKWYQDYSMGNPRNEGETDQDYAARLWKTYQGDLSAHDNRTHPPRPASAPRAPKPPVGERPATSPQKYKAQLTADAQKKNGGAPLSERQIQDINQAVGQYQRQVGMAPDQRAARGDAAPAASPSAPQLKPNWRYRINGKEVTTDAQGNIVAQ